LFDLLESLLSLIQVLFIIVDLSHLLRFARDVNALLLEIHSVQLESSVSDCIRTVVSSVIEVHRFVDFLEFLFLLELFLGCLDFNY